jgi:hypothetical protein
MTQLEKEIVREDLEEEEMVSEVEVLLSWPHVWPLVVVVVALVEQVVARVVAR